MKNENKIKSVYLLSVISFVTFGEKSVFYFKRLKLSKQLPKETSSSRKTIAINDEGEQEMLDKLDKEAIAAIFSVTEENTRYTPPDDHLMPFVILLPFLFITSSSIRSGDSQEGAPLDRVYLS